MLWGGWVKRKAGVERPLHTPKTVPEGVLTALVAGKTSIRRGQKQLRVLAAMAA